MKKNTEGELIMEKIIEEDINNHKEKYNSTRDKIINDFIDETFTDTRDFIEKLYGDNQDESMLLAMSEYEKWYGEGSGSITADDKILNYLCPLADAIHHDIDDFDYTPLAKKLNTDIDDEVEMGHLIYEVVTNISNRILDYFEKHYTEYENEIEKKSEITEYDEER